MPPLAPSPLIEQAAHEHAARRRPAELPEASNGCAWRIGLAFVALFCAVLAQWFGFWTVLFVAGIIVAAVSFSKGWRHRQNVERLGE